MSVRGCARPATAARETRKAREGGREGKESGDHGAVCETECRREKGERGRDGREGAGPGELIEGHGRHRGRDQREGAGPAELSRAAVRAVCDFSTTRPVSWSREHGVGPWPASPGLVWECSTPERGSRPSGRTRPRRRSSED